MNRIDQTFANAKSQGKTVFLPFVSAGDPDLPTTEQLMTTIATRAQQQEAPMVMEVGFPYSDPIADGAVIQASFTRALDAGVTLAKIFASIEKVRAAQPDLPLAAMVSYSIVYRNGGTAFLQRAKSAGFDGAIIPDLPIEESSEVENWAKENDFKLIHLVAPTSPADRAERIAKGSTGFLYIITVAGTTGARTELPPDLDRRLDQFRTWTSVPLCVGFGISQPQQVKALAGRADGVIVGSAIVRQVEGVKPGDASGVDRVADYVASLFP